MKHPTIETESSQSSRHGSKIFPSLKAVSTKNPDVRRTSVNSNNNNNFMNNINGLHNRSTFLDLTLEDEESDESDRVQYQKLSKSKSRMSIGAISSLSGESKAYLEDFKKYVKNKQKINQSKTILDDEFKNNDNGHGQRNEGDGNNMNAASGGSRSKIKMSTMKVMNEIRKKLKLQIKSKADRFEESMQLFKSTDTYIEIKPFLEQLNLLNHQKYIQEVNRYETNIQQAKENIQHEEFMKKILPIGEGELLEGTGVVMSIQDKKMKHFRELLIKANNLVLNSPQQMKYKMLADTLSQQILTELGLHEGDMPEEEEEEEKWEQQKGTDKNKMRNEGQKEEEEALKSGSFYPTAVNPEKLQKEKKNTSSSHKAQQKVVHHHQTAAQQQSDMGELQSDENQFFVNLSSYLNKAQKDINLRNELESEMNTYALVIKENEEKLNEAKTQQLRRFGGARGQFDPDSLFKADKNIAADKYYERFREKSEQVRLTLNKVNQELFNQKWANAQIKRKMERQRERNKILSQFNNSKGTNMEDLLNPSKKMNDAILKRRQKLQEQEYTNAHKISANSQIRSSRLMDNGNNNENVESNSGQKKSEDMNSVRNTTSEVQNGTPGDVQEMQMPKLPQIQQQQGLFYAPSDRSLPKIDTQGSVRSINNSINDSNNKTKMRNLSLNHSSHKLKEPSSFTARPLPLALISTANTNNNHSISTTSLLKSTSILSPGQSSLSPTKRRLFSKQFKLADNNGSNHQLDSNRNTNLSSNGGSSQKSIAKLKNNNTNTQSTDFKGDIQQITSNRELKLPLITDNTQQFNSNNNNHNPNGYSISSLMTPLKKVNELTNINDLATSASSRSRLTQQNSAQQPHQLTSSLKVAGSQSRLRLPQKVQIMTPSHMNAPAVQQSEFSNFSSVQQQSQDGQPGITSALNVVSATEEQQQMDQLIQEIEEEREEFKQEKGQISDQLAMIDENYDKDMSKYRTDERLESLRGVNVATNDYSSQLPTQKYSFKPKTTKAYTHF